MDYLVSSGGCPIAGNLNILPGSENFVREVELLNSKEISSMHIPYSKDNFFPTEEQARESLCVQDPHLDKRFIQPPPPLRPQPTPAPAPKPQEVNVNIRGAQQADLVSHYEKLVDRLEREIARLTAELEKVRSE